MISDSVLPSAATEPPALQALLDSLQPFALLDDAGDSAAGSRLYWQFEQLLECRQAADWPAFIAATETALAAGCFAVPLLAYETGAQLQGILNVQAAEAQAPRHQAACSRMLIFRHCSRWSQQQLQAWLQPESLSATAQHSLPPAGIAALQSSTSAAQFDAALAKIHGYIEAGDTYQVNYTVRLHFQVYGGGWPLYQRLRQRQPVPYGAFIRLPDRQEILSCSPELFIRHQQGQLFARPMKGTAAASGDPLLDQQRAAELAADSKNRAENLMIVDLLRNDLGRVAQTGSVQVPRLFEVNRFASVLQMTSSIQAELNPAIGLADLLAALFPCGSITGAPKRRTMEIIQELESEPRGLYTGAIGWIDPAPAGSARLPDFCLSVPIRTLALAAPSAQADGCLLQTGVMGVGAGIVYDSVSTDEYAECALKARFLTGLPAQFGLIETLYADASGIRHLDQHLARLAGSAGYFGFSIDLPALRQALTARLTELGNTAPQQAYRLRLELQPDGSWQLSDAALPPLAAGQSVLLAGPGWPVIDSRQVWLRHKTTLRQQYDQSWRAAEQLGAFDMLLFNQVGHVCEGGRSSVFIEQDGQLLTPPLSDGVLAGVMRSRILADPQYRASERSLTRSDLQRADRIYLCNALRGLFPVRLQHH